MSEENKELTKKQLEKVKGGARIIGFTGDPHCRACSGEMACFEAFFRCKAAGCKEFGNNKKPSEVDWY